MNDKTQTQVQALANYAARANFDVFQLSRASSCRSIFWTRSGVASPL
jgi:hypothetical protein